MNPCSTALDSVTHNIRINCVCPSYVETPMVHRGFEKAPGWREVIEKMSPMGRLAQPGEVADVVMFLSSSRSSYVAGVGLVISGGGGL